MGLALEYSHDNITHVSRAVRRDFFLFFIKKYFIESINFKISFMLPSVVLIYNCSILFQVTMKYRPIEIEKV